MLKLVSCIVVESQSCSCLQNDGAFSSYKGVCVDMTQLLVSHEKAGRKGLDERLEFLYEMLIHEYIRDVSELTVFQFWYH